MLSHLTIQTKIIMNKKIEADNLIIELTNIELKDSDITIAFKLSDKNNSEIFNTAYNYIIYDNASKIISHTIMNSDFTYYKLGFFKENFMKDYSYIVLLM